jgi:hypothetical protein
MEISLYVNEPFKLFYIYNTVIKFFNFYTYLFSLNTSFELREEFDLPEP